MSTTLPVSFRASPLPSNFRGTPQRFLDALIARISIESQDSLSFFVTGAVAPTSNVGPWLKNGTTWYVWDTGTGAYVPEVIEFQSLRYIASQAAPDQAKYTFWIELDGSGKAIAVKYYSGGAWKDVYEDKFGTYSTTTQMNTAIANAITAGNNRLPVNAYMGGSQTVPIDTFPHKLAYNTVLFDPGSNYDNAQYRYTAEFNGIYRVSAHVQVDNDTAVASDMELSFRLSRNGNSSQPTCYGGTSVASPPGSRWYPQFNGTIQLNAGDYLEIVLIGVDGTNTGDVTCSNGNFQVELLQQT
jgi:hypothetical protein